MAGRTLGKVTRVWQGFQVAGVGVFEFAKHKADEPIAEEHNDGESTDDECGDGRPSDVAESETDQDSAYRYCCAAREGCRPCQGSD